MPWSKDGACVLLSFLLLDQSPGFVASQQIHLFQISKSCNSYFLKVWLKLPQLQREVRIELLPASNPIERGFVKSRFSLPSVLPLHR